MRTIAAILASIATTAITVPVPNEYGVSSQSPAAPAPTYGKPCKIIKGVEYREEFDTKCHTTYSYELCVPTQRTKCDTKRRQKCKDNYRTVHDTVVEHVCEDRPSKVCEKHWEEDGKGGKVWVDDPATCKTVYQTHCRNVEKKVPRREKYQTCRWESYQDCYLVPGPHKCSKVDKRKCLASCETGVPRTLQCTGGAQGVRPNPHFVKGSVCKESAKEECRQVHKEVPYQTQRQVCPGEPGYASGSGSGSTFGSSYGPGSSIDPRDIADAFNQAIENSTIPDPDPRTETQVPTETPAPTQGPVIDPRAIGASGSDTSAVIFPN